MCVSLSVCLSLPVIIRLLLPSMSTCCSNLLSLDLDHLVNLKKNKKPPHHLMDTIVDALLLDQHFVTAFTRRGVMRDLIPVAIISKCQVLAAAFDLKESTCWPSCRIAMF